MVVVMEAVVVMRTMVAVVSQLATTTYMVIIRAKSFPFAQGIITHIKENVWPTFVPIVTPG